MNYDPNKPEKRIGFAPSTTLMPFSSIEANRVLSVKLEADEEVEWTWTYWPNGERSVTGYVIIKNTPEDHHHKPSRKFYQKRRLKRDILLGKYSR